jgi:hypothetical protein
MLKKLNYLQYVGIYCKSGIRTTIMDHKEILCALSDLQTAPEIEYWKTGAKDGLTFNNVGCYAKCGITGKNLNSLTGMVRLQPSRHRKDVTEMLSYMKKLRLAVQIFNDRCHCKCMGHPSFRQPSSRK